MPLLTAESQELVWTPDKRQKQVPHSYDPGQAPTSFKLSEYFMF